MSLAEFADLAEVVGALGVIAGLVFVGVQMRQNTKQLRRAEANMAMAQGSALRHLLLNNRETAELVYSGVAGAPLDPFDEIRLNIFFSELVFMVMHVWDRARSGLAPPDELTRGIIPTLRPLLASQRAIVWWARARSTFRPDFVADFELALPALRPPAPASSTTAPQEPAGAVARTSDAG